MTRKKSPGKISGPDAAACYRRRAQGGGGLIISERTTIDRPAASFDTNIPNIHDPHSIAGWQCVLDASGWRSTMDAMRLSSASIAWRRDRQ
jgi:2,4-dienoyl-CoA reductase-like NADH-dependent reductase (Old Yellow Enzyme family)